MLPQEDQVHVGLRLDADNPFSTRYIRPGAIPYQLPPGTTLSGLVERFEAHAWRGAILGPHGSGKSTLVAALIPAIEAVGKSVLRIELHDGQRRLPVDLGQAVSGQTQCVVIIDGYEQLSWWNRWRVQRLCRRRAIGLLVTSHKPVGLPELCRTSTDLALAQSIVASLVAGRCEPIALDEWTPRFESHQGNLRETLFDLYDLYEKRRAAGL